MDLNGVLEVMGMEQVIWMDSDIREQLIEQRERWFDYVMENFEIYAAVEGCLVWVN